MKSRYVVQTDACDGCYEVTNRDDAVRAAFQEARYAVATNMVRSQGLKPIPKIIREFFQTKECLQKTRESFRIKKVYLAD